MENRPACAGSKNKAFINPYASPAVLVEEAKKMCAQCPVLKQCAKDGLSSGTTLAEDYQGPANDVILAGIVCDGSPDTAYRLSVIAGVEVPATVGDSAKRGTPGDTCRECGEPMVRWHRQETPPGYVMHYARGFCTNCRSAYAEWKKLNPAPPRGLRKITDRKRHSAPKRRRGEVTVQFSLFNAEDLVS